MAKVVFLTSPSGTYTLPSDWNASNNSIEMIDGGGGARQYGHNYTGGKGGDYRKYTNVGGTAGQVLNYVVGQGGSGLVYPASASLTPGGTTSMDLCTSVALSYTGGASFDNWGRGSIGGGAAGPGGNGSNATDTARQGTAASGSWTQTSDGALAAPGNGYCGPGGNYGGGGGGTYTSASITQYPGAPGIIVITYEPYSATPVDGNASGATVTATASLLNSTKSAAAGTGGTASNNGAIAPGVVLTWAASVIVVTNSAGTPVVAQPGISLTIIEGWDSYATFADITSQWTYQGFGTNAAIVTGAFAKFGGNALQIGNGGGAVRRALPVPVNTAWTGAHLRKDRGGFNAVMQFLSGVPSTSAGSTSTVEVSLHVDFDSGAVSIYRNMWQINGGFNVGVLLGVAARRVPKPQSFHFYEFGVFRHATAGWVEVWVDGIPFLQLTNVNTKYSSNPNITLAQIGSPIDDAAFLTFDDMYVTLGPRLGEMRVASLVPSSDATPNNGTTNGATTVDQWDAATKGASIVLTNTNLDVAHSGTGGVWNSVHATSAHNTGKWVFEYQITAQTTTSPTVMFGLCAAATDMSTWLGNSTDSVGWYLSSSSAPTMFGTGFTVLTTAVYTFAVGDKIMLAVDFDAGKVWIGKNGAWTAGGDPASGGSPNATFTPTGKKFFAAMSTRIDANGVVRWNTTPVGTIPTGFSAWHSDTTSHFATVSENPVNTSDYVTLTNVENQREMFGLTDLPANASEVFGVRVAANAKHVTGTSQTSLSMIAKSGSSESVSGIKPVPTTSFFPVSEVFAANPATSGPWTPTSANALVAGVKVTVP